jgi:hypothetical protein
MTTREPVSTNLILGIIMPLYEMQQEDIQALAADLERQVRIEYVRTVQRLLTLHGCQKTAQIADARSLTWIAEYARATSEGIARTYNRELSNKIRTLYTANPRGNRFYYMRGLDTWTRQRNGYKTASIALNTMTAARSYAQDRFYRENTIGGRFRPVGPPPVCKICIRIFAKGPLTWEECQKPANRFPAHVGCPHKHEIMVPTRIRDCDSAWTG